jgi:transcriptional regulator with XRE-family HTH domain
MADDGDRLAGNLSVFDPRIYGELRRIRLQLALSGEAVASKMSWSKSKLSRIELGRSAITLSSLTALLDYYETCGLPASRASALLMLASSATVQPAAVPRGSRADGTAGSVQAVSEWAPVTVPWLLRQPAYAAAVLAGRQQATQEPPGHDGGLILGLRQRLAASPPLRLRAVLDESVLYRLAGTRQVMHSQLSHLARVSREPGTDIEIRILPLESGVVPGAGQFTCLQYPALPGISASAAILADDLDGPQLLDLPAADAWRRCRVFRELWALAADPGPLIRRALRTWA